MKHIALTIGPIIETLSLGRKTSEVWMASYIFSSFMKNTIRKIKERSDAEFIIPYVDDEILKEQDDGIGMFHDRCILKSDTLTLTEVEDILQEEKDAIAVMVAESIKKDVGKVKAFFTQYLQTYLLETIEVFKNPILDISKIMDSIELHTPLLEADEDYMRLFLNRNIILNSSLAKTSFGGKPRFDSIEAIMAQELGEDIDVKNAYKYIAIIYADGDNLGEYIKSQSNVTKVSEKLFEFDKKAASSIKDYGALPIFIGGDDLIIFAPLLNKGETVFDLLNKLSDDYATALDTEKSTLSFGVSITYYKYPLYEALERARDTLFDVAKQYEGKNAVAVSTQKHSGQSFDFCIGKSDDAYETFLALIRNVLNEEVELPHAIHQKLQKHQKVFESIPSDRISNTFENIFNEDIHKNEFYEGLGEIQELMKKLGLETNAQEKLFSMLSTIKVLRGDR